MEADAGLAINSLRVDGGAAANDLLMQIQADLLGVQIFRPEMVESTALGAAKLAARGIGLPPDEERRPDRPHAHLHARMRCRRAELRDADGCARWQTGRRAAPDRRPSPVPDASGEVRAKPARKCLIDGAVSCER